MWMRSSPEGDRKALWSPPQRRNPCNKKDQQQENHFSRCWSVTPIWRDNVRVVGKASWGRICGCAKLLAGTLRCLRLCWARLAKWSREEQLGRCPKPYKTLKSFDSNFMKIILTNDFRNHILFFVKLHSWECSLSKFGFTLFKGWWGMGQSPINRCLK